MTFLKPSLFPACAVMCALLSGCSMFGGDKKDVSAGDERAGAAQTAADVKSADALFSEGSKLLKKRKYKKAVEAFEELDTTYPYSDKAIRGQILSAYASYLNQDYDDAIAKYDAFLRFNPGHQQADYVYYMRARAYYDRISDVGRDQGITESARTALLDVVRRFPDSDYARDAKLKLGLAEDHLAGKEMQVGRFYQKQLKQAAAINRFKNVLQQYQTTSHVKEALFRMTESYLALGITEEALKYASILGYNYPHSGWYKKAYKLMKTHGGLPEPDKG